MVPKLHPTTDDASSRRLARTEGEPGAKSDRPAFGAFYVQNHENTRQAAVNIPAR